MRLSVVIPAYNEEDRIVTTLTETLSYLEKQDYESEVVVVSDGSSDNTVHVVKNFSQKASLTVRALEYFPNRGKGYAVKYGMVRAEGERILFMDADYAVPIEEVKKAHALLDQGYPIAMASRALPGAVVNRHQNLPRELSSKIYNLVQRLTLGIAYSDTQCGFKMFTREAAQALFPRQMLNSVIFDPEILWLAKKQGFTVGQFPVTWSHVEDSRIVYDSLGKSLFVFQELFRIRKLHRGQGSNKV